MNQFSQIARCTLRVCLDKNELALRVRIRIQQTGLVHGFGSGDRGTLPGAAAMNKAAANAREQADGAATFVRGFSLAAGSDGQAVSPETARLALCSS